MSIVHIPFYPSDWLSGTCALSDAEKGVYITLVAHMYEMAGPIKWDNDRLFRMCGCKSKSGFLKSLQYLMDSGKIIVVDGELFNEKADKVIKATTEKSSKAKAAAQSRWDKKTNKNNGGDDADASPKHMPQECHPKPKPYPEEREAKASLSPDADLPAAIDEIAQAVSAYNIAADQSGWPKVANLSKARRTALAARLKDAGGIAGWHDALAKAQASPHCCGQNDRGWVASFDFLTKQSSFTKLMEGNYDDRTQNNHTRGGTQPRRSNPHQSLMAGFGHVAEQNRG